MQPLSVLIVGVGLGKCMVQEGQEQTSIKAPFSGGGLLLPRLLPRCNGSLLDGFRCPWGRTSYL